ncbi:hypothetical protein D3C83_14050 [compost metagenome]
MRWASLSSPTSSQVTCGLLKSFIFIIICGLASSCEAQEPQDASGFGHASHAPVPATRLLSGREPDPNQGLNRSPQAAIEVATRAGGFFSGRKFPLGEPGPTERRHSCARRRKTK